MTTKEQFIAIVNNDCICRSDAIILLEGDGYNRYLHAVNLYKQGFAPLIVFSGNIVNYEYGSFPLSLVLPKIEAEGISKDVVMHEKKSLNTREQAVEIVNLCQKNGWNKLILVASPEHQYRAFLTFLREILDTNSSVLLFNSASPNLGWYKNDGWGTRIERLLQEFERIEKYTQMGHLASFEEAIKYQKWKEQQ